MPLLKLEEIYKHYQLGDQSIEVLRGISFSVENGDFISIMGQSGSGKSTLMNIIGLLDTPTTGRYFINGEAVENFDEDRLTKIRRRSIGFVFQQYNLLPRMNALKQVELPLAYQGVSLKERESRALEALRIVGLSDRIHNRPNELSGGQQQRVSIARAIVTNPGIILADEPTGALDSKSGEDVIKILRDLNQQGRTVILITHEKRIAENAKKIIHISDGRITTDTL